MLVKAVERCFRNGILRQPGDEFEDTKAKKAADLPPWLEPVKKGSKPEPPKEEEE